MLRIPEHHRRHTLMAIGYGALLLAWLTPEDATLIIVSVLGAGLSLMVSRLAGLRWLGGKTLTPRQWIPGLVVWGAFVGFGAVWATVLLMVFKNAWHSHAAPDFAGTVVAGIMRRSIPWTAAGALLGGAVALVRIALHRDEPLTDS